MIKEGDYVKHMTNDTIRHITMEVLDVNGNKVLCRNFNSVKNEFIKNEFNLEDLYLVKEGDSGFF